MKSIQSLLTKGLLLTLGLFSTGHVQAAIVDGQYILAGGPHVSDTEHRIYDAATGAVVVSVNTDTGNGTTQTLAWQHCGNKYTAGQTVSTGSEIFTYDFSGSSVTQLQAVGSDLIVNGTAWSHNDLFHAFVRNISAGGELLVYDSSNTFISNFEISSNVFAVDWRPGDAQIAIGGSTATDIRVYPVNGMGAIGALVATQDTATTVNSIAWRPDGNYLAVGDSGATGQLKVYPWTGAAFGTVITGPDDLGNIANSVDWSPDGTYLAVGADVSPRVRVYRFDGSSLTSVATYDHGATVNAVSWYRDGNNLAIGGVSGTGPGGDGTATLRSLAFDGSSLTQNFGVATGGTVNAVDVGFPLGGVDAAITDGNKLLVNEICPIASGCEFVIPDEDGTTRFSGNVAVAEGKTLCTETLLVNKIFPSWSLAKTP